MPGVAGRSGRPRKPVDEHLLAGTYRRDRHGPLEPGIRLARSMAVARLTAPSPSTRRDRRDPDDREARRLLRGLSREARGMGRALLAEYEGWSVADLAVLRLILTALDRAAECRKVIAADGVMPGKRGARKVHPLIRVEHQARTFIVGALRGLNLEGGK